jgi:hypothetical protein
MVVVENTVVVAERQRRTTQLKLKAEILVALDMQMKAVDGAALRHWSALDTLQDRRRMNAASVAFPSERRLSPRSDRSLGIRQQIDGLGWRRETLCIGTRDPRDEARVPPSGWPAGPDRPPGGRSWDSEADSEAAGRRERMALLSGYGTVGPSNWHARSAI